jgi:hypothetical protein
MTRLTERTVGRYLAVFRLLAPDTGTHDIEIIDLAGGENQIGMVCSLTGVDQTTPEDTPVESGTDSGVSTTTTGAINSASGDLILDVVHVNSDFSASLAPTTGSVPTNGLRGAGLGSTLACSTEAGAVSVTKTWTWASNNSYAHVVLNLNAAAGGGGGAPVRSPNSNAILRPFNMGRNFR